MTRLLILTVAFAAAVAVVVGVTMPPHPASLAPAPDGTVAGILHVHSNRSDGRGTPDEIAAAAARAGLRFVVFTDHGDATRAPDPPTYRAGVLCLDGVEISTSGGHYLAFDMPPSPYPLAGEPRDVVEDVRRLGGFGVVAHPDSPNPAFRWRDWTAPFDAMEWLNLDATWRRLAQTGGAAGRLRLFAALVDYPFRPAATIASLVEGTGESSRWEETLVRGRRVVLLAGADAHARIALRHQDWGDTRYSLPFPGYESSFRALSIHVRPAAALSGLASADAALVLRAIRGGHAYTAVDGLATPPSFEFTATNTLGTVREGDELGVGGPVTLQVRSNAPHGFTTIINEGQRALVTAPQPNATVEAAGGPAVFWAEVRAPSRPGDAIRRWVLSNPIYVGGGSLSSTPPSRPPAAVTRPLLDDRTAAAWSVEHDAASLAALDVPATIGGWELRMRYALGGGAPAGQFAALVLNLPNGAATDDRLAFTVRAERAMRVSVQLRKPGGATTSWERWQRSVRVEPFDREHTVFFDDLMPIGETGTFRPPLADVRSILFVVDTTNTKPGSSGRLWIKTAAVQK
jgi:hypothetical protein